MSKKKLNSKCDPSVKNLPEMLKHYTKTIVSCCLVKSMRGIIKGIMGYHSFESIGVPGYNLINVLKHRYICLIPIILYIVSQLWILDL